MNKNQIDKIAKKIITSSTMTLKPSSNSKKIELEFKESYGGYDILIDCRCLISFGYVNEFKCLYELTIKKGNEIVFHEGNLSASEYSNQSRYLKLNSGFFSHVSEYKTNEQCIKEISDAAEKMIANYCNQIDNGEFGISIANVLNYWKLGDCQVSRLCKKRDSVSIYETTKLKDCGKALQDLRHFLKINGYKSPEQLKVSVKHDIEKYSDREFEDPDENGYEYEQYGSKGDRVEIELNGQKWKWGM